MNLRGIDLNLLTILHALLEEAHVSRAAVRLGMSQPATSSALDRCRQMLGDPLLERLGGSMRLTPTAEALRRPLTEIMEQVSELLDVQPQPLSEVLQAVHVVMADVLGAYLCRRLRDAVGAKAPGIGLVLHPWGGGPQALEQLARGSIDLAVSVLPSADERMFHVETVFEEHYVVGMRRNHPAADGFCLDRWLAWPHVIVSAQGNTRTPVDDALAAIGRERRIGMVVPSFLLVPDLVQNTDMIALLPARAFDCPTGIDLATFSPPLPLDGFTLRLAWHRRRQQDRAVQLVASEIRYTLSSVGSGRQTPSG